MDKQSWKDSEGNVWLTTFKAVDAVRLRESAAVDIMDPKSMEQIFGDSLYRIEVMAELSRRQWEPKGLNYEQFSDAVMSTPTSLIDATTALQASISYFFRQLGRGDLATVCDRAWEMAVAQAKALEARAGGEKVGAILQKVAAKGMAEVDAELDRALEAIDRGIPFGSLSGSTEATGVN